MLSVVFFFIYLLPVGFFASSSDSPFRFASALLHCSRALITKTRRIMTDWPTIYARCAIMMMITDILTHPCVCSSWIPIHVCYITNITSLTLGLLEQPGPACAYRKASGSQPGWILADDLSSHRPIMNVFFAQIAKLARGGSC